MISLIIATAIAFLTTLIIVPELIKFLYSANIVGLDLHKRDRPRVPASGGVTVAVGLVIGILAYIGMETFVYGSVGNNSIFLATVCSVLLATSVGFADDMNVKSRAIRTKDGLNIKAGLSQNKWLLTLPAAVPLMVIAAGDTTMAIPFIGNVNFGMIYPLVLIPIGVVGASNVVNMLGGFNGAEAGMGAVYMLSLGLYAFLHGSPGAVIFLISFASLIAFLKYNAYPARILPGDSLTYLLGSTVAAGVIIGNLEKIGVIVLMPFIIEFFLKARKRFKASSLGKLRKDGKLDSPYGRNIYSWTHILMNMGKLTEKQVTICLILIQVVFSSLIFLGIF